MKRIASHYLLFCKDRLSPLQESRILAATPILSPLSPQENEEVLNDFAPHPSIATSHIPTTSPINLDPSTLGGFRKCVVEISETGQLLRIFPFTHEIESTEWHPGLLWLDKICQP